MKSYFIPWLSFFVLLSTLLTGKLIAQERTVTYPYDASYYIQDKEIELSHLDANLLIKPFDTLVKGTACFTFRTLKANIDSIVFSVPELAIDHIYLDDMPIQYKNNGSNVIIIMPRSITRNTTGTLKFVYSARPTEGLYFIGWNDPSNIKRKQVWAHRPGHWLPYFDGIITVEMSVTVDEKYKVFNNGVREKVVSNADHTKTWTYRMPHPHPFFSTCLVIGEYDFISTTTSKGLPLELWYYPDWKDHVEPTYRYLPEMVDFFEKEFGFGYPWELYREAPVIDYMYGAMETTTSTIFGDYLMVDERGYLGRNYVNVNAHELAHQWFGNYISHLKGTDLWLTESFATYWAKKFEQHVFGEDYYQDVRNKELNETYEAAMLDNYAVGHGSGGRARWYPKGSLVLDMMRNILGDEAFRESIKLYLESFPYQNAETSDFLQSIRKASGMSMEWFFEEWIYRGGEPQYDIKYLSSVDENQQPVTRIEIEQTHQTNEITGLFKMPFDFEVHFQDGSTEKKTQWISEKREVVEVPNPSRKTIDFVLFDPGRKVIKKVTFNRNYEELSAQLLKSEQMIDRYDALVALRDYSPEKKRVDLINCYQKESFYLLKSEVISQLAGDQESSILKLLMSAISDSSDKVRLAVTQQIKRVPFKLKSHYEKLLFDPAFLTVELALENLCNSFPSEIDHYLELTKATEGWRGKNIRIKWLEIAILNGKVKYQKELISYSGDSYEFETRINAANALKRLNLLTEAAVKNLIAGLTHWNYKIHNACFDSLKYFYAQDKYRQMVDKVVSNGIPEQARAEIEKIRASSK
jgi:aminopeptidase N